jgi:hypothetical protein
MTGKPKGSSQRDCWIQSGGDHSEAELLRAALGDEERSAASNFAICTAVTGNLQDLQEWNLCHVFQINKLTNNICLNDSLASITLDTGSRSVSD